jgi:hypothetical protein
LAQLHSECAYFPSTTHGFSLCGGWRLYKATESFMIPACDLRRKSRPINLSYELRMKDSDCLLEECVHFRTNHYDQEGGYSLMSTY